MPSHQRTIVVRMQDEFLAWFVHCAHNAGLKRILPSGQMPRWCPLITTTPGGRRNCKSSGMPSWSRDHQAGWRLPKQTVAVGFDKSIFFQKSVSSLTFSCFECKEILHGELQQLLHWQRRETRMVEHWWAMNRSSEGVFVRSVSNTKLNSNFDSSILWFVIFGVQH